MALNGQQFTKDAIIHWRDDSNTFEYYVEPFVSSYSPKSGPSIGGTHLLINGFGFAPRKDAEGNMDKSKNKMYVRFVDPDTKEELAPATQVHPEDLSDDEARW